MLNEKLPRTLRNFSLAIMIFAFLGFLDSMYLTASRFFGIPLQCNITSGCETVTTSTYSEIFGIPVVLIGVIFYLIMFFGAFAYFETNNTRLLRLVSVLPVGGFLFSVWLVYVQLFILKAICQYCMASAIISTVLFALGLMVLRISAPSPSLTAGDAG